MRFRALARARSLATLAAMRRVARRVSSSHHGGMAMIPTDGSGHRLDNLLRREWLITNHLGGYASSTIPSLNTRKYHGLLVAAMAPPVRRMVLLSRVEETVHCDGWPTPLACNEYPGTIFPNGNDVLRAFSPDPFPRWAFQGENWTLQKELCLLP